MTEWDGDVKESDRPFEDHTERMERYLADDVERAEHERKVSA